MSRPQAFFVITKADSNYQNGNGSASANNRVIETESNNVARAILITWVGTKSRT